jgi:hypothetical protein
MPPLAAPEFAAGSPDVLQGARQLFASAGWIRRRANEILAEVDLDPLKIYDLAGHCFLFRQEADKWLSAGEVTRVLEELVKLTQSAGVGNAARTPAQINADYKALYAEAGSFITWAQTNLPGVGQPIVGATVTVNRTWPNTDLIVRLAKLPAVQTRVQTLRNVFD